MAYMCAVHDGGSLGPCLDHACGWRGARDCARPSRGLGITRAPRATPGRRPLRLSHQPLPHSTPVRPYTGAAPPLIASFLARARARPPPLCLDRERRARARARERATAVNIPALRALSRFEGHCYQRARRELVQLLRELLLAREQALLVVAHRVELRRKKARARAARRRGGRRGEEGKRIGRGRGSARRIRGPVARAANRENPPPSARPAAWRRRRRPTWAAATPGPRC